MLKEIVNKTLGKQAELSHFKDNTYIIGLKNKFKPSYIQYAADQLANAIPKDMLDPTSTSPIRVGTGGATEGMIIIKLK